MLLVQVKRLHRDVIEAIDREARLFVNLAKGRMIGALARLDVSVDGLPRPGASYGRGALEQQDVPVIGSA